MDLSGKPRGGGSVAPGRDDKEPTVLLLSSREFASCAFTSSGSSHVLFSAKPTSEDPSRALGSSREPRKRRDASEYASAGKTCGLREREKKKQKQEGACSWDQFTFAQNRGIMLDLLRGWGFTMCWS